MRMEKYNVFAAVMVLPALFLSGCMWMMAAHHDRRNGSDKEANDVFWQEIKTSDSPKKHLSIAEAYRRDAEDYRSLAEEHRKRKEAYRKYGDKHDKNMEFMITHCQRLVEKFTELANEMESMARKHEEMAEKLSAARENSPD